MYASTAFLSPDLPLPILLQVNKLELCLTDQIYGESGLMEVPTFLKPAYLWVLTKSKCLDPL